MHFGGEKEQSHIMFNVLVRLHEKGRTHHIVPAFFNMGDSYEPDIPPQKQHCLNKADKKITLAKISSNSQTKTKEANHHKE